MQEEATVYLYGHLIFLCFPRFQCTNFLFFYISYYMYGTVDDNAMMVKLVDERIFIFIFLLCMLVLALLFNFFLSNP